MSLIRWIEWHKSVMLESFDYKITQISENKFQVDIESIDYQKHFNQKELRDDLISQFENSGNMELWKDEFMELKNTSYLI